MDTIKNNIDPPLHAVSTATHAPTELLTKEYVLQLYVSRSMCKFDRKELDK